MICSAPCGRHGYRRGNALGPSSFGNAMKAPDCAFTAADCSGTRRTTRRGAGGLRFEPAPELEVRPPALQPQRLFFPQRKRRWIKGSLWCGSHTLLRRCIKGRERVAACRYGGGDGATLRRQKGWRDGGMEGAFTSAVSPREEEGYGGPGSDAAGPRQPHGYLPSQPLRGGLGSKVTPAEVANKPNRGQHGGG